MLRSKSTIRRILTAMVLLIAVVIYTWSPSESITPVVTSSEMSSTDCFKYRSRIAKEHLPPLRPEAKKPITGPFLFQEHTPKLQELDLDILFVDGKPTPEAKEIILERINTLAYSHPNPKVKKVLTIAVTEYNLRIVLIPSEGKRSGAFFVETNPTTGQDELNLGFGAESTASTNTPEEIGAWWAMLTHEMAHFIQWSNEVKSDPAKKAAIHKDFPTSGFETCTALWEFELTAYRYACDEAIRWQMENYSLARLCAYLEDEEMFKNVLFSYMHTLGSNPQCSHHWAKHLGYEEPEVFKDPHACHGL